MPGGLFSDLERRIISAAQPWSYKIHWGLLNNPPGTRGRPTTSAATSKPSCALMGSRSGSHRSSPARYTTAARAHVLGALDAAASRGLPTLADPGYEGAGIGVHTPGQTARRRL